ncbi:MAG: hypothetical protein IT446_03165 [Phycisphaerales bacterium]|nr:hypothetical protein [Phycisphaerales bacterium]
MTKSISPVRSSKQAAGALQVRVARDAEPSHRVSEMLLGQNIETVEYSVMGMLTDRLENPKFVGPALAHGLPSPWLLPGFHYTTFKAELSSGMSMSYGETLRLHNYKDGSKFGLVQIGRSVRAGETLAVDFWAKAINQPVEVEIHLYPPELRKAPYGIRTIVVDASYWKNYQVELEIPESTDQAVFQFLITGPGQLWLDQIHMRPVGEGHVCREVLQSMESMRIPILRFPGGCFSTNYHWKFGTGPVHLRPAVRDETVKLPAYYDFGTDEYLDLCLKQKITPMITVNIGSGTPQEAGEWAAYIADFYRRNGQQPPLAYFQMGNEHYGAWESAHMTGRMYAEALREFIPAVRNNYPDARIVALGEKNFQTLRPDDDNAWRDRVLEVVNELGIDVITINRYKGQWNESDLDKQINVVQSVTKVRRDFEELIGDCRKAGLSTKIGITEWNYWMRASAYDGRRFTEDYDVSHALYISGMIHLFARMAADMELATFYHLINPMGIIQHYTADVVESCIVELFRMYRPAFPADFVPMDIESPKLGEDESAVDGICLRQKEGDWVFLSNRHPTQSARVELGGFNGRVGEMMMLSGETPMGQLRPADAPAVKEGHVTLPPLSVLRMRFES